MDKSKEIHGLHKIPDNALLRLANIEIGKLKAYIEELELRGDKKDTIEALRQANSHLRRQNKKLREEKRNRK